MRAGWIALALALSACGQEAAPEPEEPPAAEAPAEPAEEEGAVHLGVPAEAIHRARLEARGLARMTDAIRAQVLERGRANATLDYAELRAHPDRHADARVSFEGRIGLARSAGEQLWILALQTREEGDRWTDPLYVLSVVPAEVPAEGGVPARIDGWVVGERTIGRHALPLVVAFSVQPGG